MILRSGWRRCQRGTRVRSKYSAPRSSRISVTAGKRRVAHFATTLWNNFSVASASAMLVWPWGNTDGYCGEGNALSRCSAIGKESFIAPFGLDVMEVLWMIAGRVYRIGGELEWSGSAGIPRPALRGAMSG